MVRKNQREVCQNVNKLLLGEQNLARANSFRDQECSPPVITPTVCATGSRAGGTELVKPFGTQLILERALGTEHGAARFGCLLCWVLILLYYDHSF